MRFPKYVVLIDIHSKISVFIYKKPGNYIHSSGELFTESLSTVHELDRWLAETNESVKYSGIKLIKVNTLKKLTEFIGENFASLL